MQRMKQWARKALILLENHQNEAKVLAGQCARRWDKDAKRAQEKIKLGEEPILTNNKRDTLEEV